MPQFCAVVGCGSNGARDRVSFFRFPSIKNNRGNICDHLKRRRESWIGALKRLDLTENKLKYERVCSLHFISGKPAHINDTENPDWIPNQNLGHKSIKHPKDLKRFNRLKCRTSNKAQQQVSSENNELEEVNGNPVQSEQTIQVLQASTSQNEEPIVNMEEMQFALINANKTIYDLREKLSLYEINEDYFKNSDSKTLYYTGLPNYNYLQVVFKAVEPFLSEIHSSSLNKFQQLILTLMKLRHDFQFSDLAHRFIIDRRTVSRIFYKCIDILYCRLKSLIIWPDRDVLHSTMPRCFLEVFGRRVTVIIDCFEVFIEKSSNVNAAAQTFSQYKHHHTLKFLIAISPQGTISYISSAYGGRCSDKFVTENDGFLDHLEPGDLVLADRGFLITKSVQLYLAEVKVPAFLKGKKQLDPRSVEETRKIASVRIHVERVIGVVRQKFQILSGIIPLIVVKNKDETDFASVDKIVTVCCALTNICPSIMPLE